MSTRNSPRHLRLAVVLLISFAASLVALACDTPVYRYALYRWQPTAYEVYYFHNEPAGEKDQLVRQTVDAATGTNRGESANIVYVPVNLSEDTELVGVPPDVKRAWLAKSSDVAVPAHMITSPHGVEIFTGDLDANEISAVIDSPVRKKIGEQLEQGKAAVFLLLESGDEKADADAVAVLAQVVADVAAGKLNLYGGPKDQFSPTKEANENEKPNEPKDLGDQVKPDNEGAEKPRPEAAYLRVSRKDEAERWLVRQLMNVENDLGDFVDKPMVFAIYGRGRALPPFIGRGVSSDNLIECVEFVTGACSCTVKEQNPGVDLLLRYDWEAASASVAKKFGAEEGNENQFGIDEFFPDLVIGGQGGIPDEFKAPPKESDETPKPDGADSAAQPSDSTQGATKQPEDVALDRNRAIAMATESNKSNVATMTPGNETSSQATQTRMVTVVVGVGIVLALLASMSFALFKGN